MEEQKAVELATAFQRTVGPARKVIRAVRFGPEECKRFQLSCPCWVVAFEPTIPALRNETHIVVQDDGKVWRRMML
jgi:hypothetical protein